MSRAFREGCGWKWEGEDFSGTKKGAANATPFLYSNIIRLFFYKFFHFHTIHLYEVYSCRNR